MATVYNHAQIGVVDASGNVNVIYPQTYAKDVVVEQGTNSYLINAGITTAQGLAENVGTDITSLKSRTSAIEEIVAASNAASHNALYRGKNLTSLGLTEICRRISAGTFDDLYIGDYFTTSITTSYGGTETVTHVLADFDTYYNCGDTALSKHHAVIVPMYCFKTTAVMNETNTTEGGYKSSYMHNTVLPVYASAMASSLGSHLISHRSLISNSVNTNATSPGYSGWTGAASGWEWSDETLELMSENCVYGSRVFGGAYDTGINMTQLAYFRLNHSAIVTGFGGAGRGGWWLRSVASSTNFAYVGGGGNAGYGGASYSLGVRPLYLLS